MTIRLDERLAGSLAARARGRIVVIDAYRSWACGTWVGDITARFAASAPEGFLPSGAVEGVPVVVRSTLSRLLDAAGAELQGGARFRRDSLRVSLDRPELWLDWLAKPAG